MKHIYTFALMMLCAMNVHLRGEVTYGDWAPFGTGNYEYSPKACEVLGLENQTVQLQKRVALDDPSVAQIKVCGLFKTADNPSGQDMVMDAVYDVRGNATLSIPETTLQMTRDDAPVMYTDLYSWLKRHYPDEPTIDIYDEVSSFYVNDNVFEISAVYYHPFDESSMSGHYYVYGEFDKLYIGDAPVYEVTVTNGSFTGDDTSLSYSFDATIGSFSEVRFALAEGHLGIVDFARVATAIRNERVQYVSVTTDGHVNVEAPAPDATQYTLVGVMYDRLGNPYDEYKLYLDYDEMWQQIGSGRYSDGFMRDFFDIEQSTFDVAVERSRTEPVRVRIVNPYRTIKPSILQGDNTAYDYTRNYYLTLEFTSSGHVLLIPSETGISYGPAGEEKLPISVTSRAWQAREAGLSEEQITEKGLWGGVKNDVVSFPKSRPADGFGALLVGWNDQYYYANELSNFRLECRGLSDLAGVDENIDCNGVSIRAIAGGVYVSGASRVRVINLQGTIVYQGPGGTISLPHGVYVVTADRMVEKIMVS